MTLSRRIPSPGSAVGTVALLPSLGTTTRVWDALLAALPDRSRLDILLFDLPGHGEAPAHADFTLSELAAGTATVIADAHSAIPVVVGGVSMGGAVAIEIARRRPDVIAAVASFNSGVRFGSSEGWDRLIDAVRAAGTCAHDIDGTRNGWFTSAFGATRAGKLVVDDILAELASVDPDGYVACCRALAGYDGASVDPPVRVPGLAVGGSADRATPAANMQAVAAVGDRIRYAELPGAHLAVVEDAPAAAMLLDGLIRQARHAQETAA